MVSVSIYLAHRIVFVVAGHVPKADASINRAIHAVLVQTPIWLGLPPHKVSNGTKRVHPEPVTLPASVRATKPPGLPSILPLDGEARHLEEVKLLLGVDLDQRGVLHPLAVGLRVVQDVLLRGVEQETPHSNVGAVHPTIWTIPGCLCRMSSSKKKEAGNNKRSPIHNGTTLHLGCSEYKDTALVEVNQAIKA